MNSVFLIRDIECVIEFVKADGRDGGEIDWGSELGEWYCLYLVM